MNVKLINPDVEVIRLDEINDNPASRNNPAEQLIEYIGRVCTHTYDLPSPGSCDEFNKEAAQQSARSLFEFNNIRLVIRFDEDCDAYYNEIKDFFQSNNNVSISENDAIPNDFSYISISASLRVYLESIERFLSLSNEKGLPIWLFGIIYHELEVNYTNILANWPSYNSLETFKNSTAFCNNSTDAIKSKMVDITNDQGTVSDKKRKVLVKLIIDREMHTELKQHRSIVHMSDAHFYYRFDGDNPLQLCVNDNLMHDSEFVSELMSVGETIFDAYDRLIDVGHLPEMASAVLPLATAVNHFMYGTVEEWEKVFRLRMGDTANPLTSSIVREIWTQMVNKNLI